MSRSLFVCVITLLTIATPSCSPESPPKEIERACYFWRVNSPPNRIELSALERLHISRVYVKVADFAGDGKSLVQTTTVHLDSNYFPRSVTVVPVVFITEDAIARLTPQGVSFAGQLIASSIKDALKSLGRPMTELQLDCDWSVRSQSQ